MKKLFALLLCLSCTVPAVAAELKTKELSLRYPDSWKAHVDTQGSINIQSPNGHTELSLTVQQVNLKNDAFNFSPADMANYVAGQMGFNGVKVSPVTKDGEGKFSFTAEGRATDPQEQDHHISKFSFYTVKEKWFVVLLERNGNAASQAVIDSIVYND